MTYLLSKNYEDKAPVFLQDPYIDGTPQVGNTLTVRWFVPGYDAADNDWSVAYQWYWGATDTTLTEAEFDETAQTFICTTDHLTGYLSCRVAVTNPSGTVVRFAANVGPVADLNAPSGGNVPAPSFSQLPTLVGTPQVGRTLSVNYGVNTINGVIYTTIFTWYRDEDGVDSGSPPAPDEIISGATGSQYVVGLADLGKHIKCRVYVENLAGSVASTTTYSAEIQAADSEIPGGAIVIDEGWLAATVNGGPGGPWVLKQNGGYYVLDTDVTQAAPSGTKGAMFYVANANITLDLNDHTLTFHTGTGPSDYATQTATLMDNVGTSAAPTDEMGNVGICLYLSWANPEIAISGSADPNGFTLKNGSLIGTGTGTLGHGVWGRRGYGPAFQNVRIESGYGRDSNAICFVGGGSMTLVDSVFISHTRTTRNRQALPACLDLGSGSSPYIARCAIIGGNCGVQCSNNALIEKNFISTSTWHTNGWGIATFGVTGCAVRNNVIAPLAGRGVYFDSGASGTSSGNICHDNVVLAWEHSNVEYQATSTTGPPLNASCFKQRWGSNGNQFYNNSCLAVGGMLASQEYTANGVFGESANGYRNVTASCINVLEHGRFPPSNTFVNNTLRAVSYGTLASGRYVAAPISAEGPEPAENIAGGITVIANNACYSNDMMIIANWDDGLGGSRMRTAWEGNTFTWQDGPASYASFVADADAKISANGFSTSVAAAVSTRWTAVKAKLSPLINSANGALQSRKAFWFYDQYTSSTAETVLQIADSTFGSGVDPATAYKPDTVINPRAYSLKSGATASLLILAGGGPVASAEVVVTPNGLTSPTTLDTDTFVTTTDPNGNCTITYWQTALVRAAGSNAALTQVNVASSTISVAGVGSAIFSHASPPASVNLT